MILSQEYLITIHVWLLTLRACTLRRSYDARVRCMLEHVARKQYHATYMYHIPSTANVHKLRVYSAYYSNADYHNADYNAIFALKVSCTLLYSTVVEITWLACVYYINIYYISEGSVSQINGVWPSFLTIHLVCSNIVYIRLLALPWDGDWLSYKTRPRCDHVGLASNSNNKEDQVYGMVRVWKRK